MIPLTKTLDPSDLAQMPEFILKVQDRFWGTEREQHEARRWEYALACLAAWEFWKHSKREIRRVVDIGGAGSPLRHMLAGTLCLHAVPVVDPEFGQTLHQYAEQRPQNDIVTCVSVIEHVPELDEFLLDLAAIVRPGGLLFLTMDCWGRAAEEKDSAHFHWMRRRIFCPETWRALAEEFHTLGFHLFGGADWDYHGDQLYESYSFASLALIKADPSFKGAPIFKLKEEE